ncbi:MAG: hypothetical protein M5R36_06690 [Deltaproteobacteria bacterium]|nr:hypothetical protein [Deltaproteobacteria bacterium]
MTVGHAKTVEPPRPTAHATPTTARRDALRNLSRIELMSASTRETELVSPASSNSVKNKTPKNATPNGKFAIPSGTTKNIIDSVLALGAMAKVNSREKIARPAMNSKAQFMKQIDVALVTSSLFSGDNSRRRS